MELSDKFKEEISVTLFNALKEKRKRKPTTVSMGYQEYAIEETGFLQVALFMRECIFPAQVWMYDSNMVALAQQLKDDIDKECQTKAGQKKIDERTSEEDAYIYELAELSDDFSNWLEDVHDIHNSPDDTNT